MPGEVALPYRIRPFGVRIAASVAAAALVFVVSLLWVSLSADVQATFSVLQRATLIAVFAAILALLNALFRTSALASEAGLTVTNGYKVRQLEWAEIVRLTLTQNRPWALLDLADGTTLSVMAIQISDGDRAREAAGRLALVIRQRSHTSRND